MRNFIKCLNILLNLTWSLLASMSDISVKSQNLTKCSVILRKSTLPPPIWGCIRNISKIRKSYGLFWYFTQTNMPFMFQCPQNLKISWQIYLNFYISRHVSCSGECQIYLQNLKSYKKNYLQLIYIYIFSKTYQVSRHS